MALKELLTDPKNFKFYAGGQGHVSTPNSFGQRSIPFGHDRPDGGSSKQPFITTPIPGVNEDPGSTFPDFLLRDPKNALNDRADDLKRISKFLTTPQGLLFITKQQLLSLQNPIVPGRPNRSSVLAGLYNPLMTLGQTAASGTGLHIEKQGLYPIFSDNEKYATVYKELSRFEATNRLTQLYNSKKQIGGIVAGTYGVSNNPNLLLSYLGGSNVNLTGKTNIPLFNDSKTPLVNTSDYDYSQFKGKKIILDYNNYLGASTKSGQLKYINILTAPDEKNNTRFLGQNSVYTLGNTFPTTNTKTTNELGVFTFRQSDYDKQNVLGRQGSTRVQNFITQIINDPTQSDSYGKASQQIYAFDYTNALINRETRVGLGNPGKRNRNKSKLTSYDNDTVDKINMIPLYRDQFVVDPVNISRDLIKFRFEVIDNANPAFSTFIHFRAFLGAINDNFKADWGATKYIGRGENFYTYNGFSRDISFTYKVMAQSRAEMKSIYQKLQYLASSLAPDYSNGYMKGNLVRLTIGDYLYIVPGIITNLTYTIPEEASWEIALTEPENNNENGTDKGLMETPQYFDVNVSFTPIHDFVPQLGNKKETALITPSKATNSYLDDTKTYNFGNNATGFTNTGSINPANLKDFATNGAEITNPFTIKTVDQQDTQTNFTGNTLPVNSPAFL